MHMRFYSTIFVPLLLAIIIYLPQSAFSETFTIPISDLREDLSTLPQDPTSTLQQRLAQQLQKELNQLGLQTGANFLFGEFPIEEFNEKINRLCLVPLPKKAHIDATNATVFIHDSSQFDFQLNSLQDITIVANLSGHIETQADAWISWGQAVPFVSDCKSFTKDNGQISASMPFDIDVTLTIDLSLSYDPQLVAIVIDKNAEVLGNLTLHGGNIKPDFGDVSLTNAILNAYESYLLNKLRSKGSDRFDQKVQEFNNRLNGLDSNGNIDNSITAFNGQTIFTFDQNPEDQAVIQDILTQLGIPDMLVQMLNERGIEILLQLIVMTDTERKNFIAELGTDIGCQALRQKYELNLSQTPLYVQEGSACMLADLYGVDRINYYNDSQCQQAVAFRPIIPEQFCASWVSKQKKTTLGNAAAWLPDLDQPNDPLPIFPSQKWTSFISTKMDVGVVSIENNKQPFVKLVNYKTITDIPRGNGTCALEMRIFKENINGQGLRPMLAIHGGTWKGRGLSVFGLEASLSHFTQQGFVVFAPFYRLVGASDGNTECNSASWREVTQDVADALQWIKDYGAYFGIIPNSHITLFGQSAGAHLATWLATNYPNDIRKALLFYPPLDVLDFLSNSIPVGSQYETFRDFGIKSLTKLFGAQGGNDELRMTDIDFSRINTTMSLSDITQQLPDTLFNFSNTNPAAPPIYLQQCATRLGIDLNAVDLAALPADLNFCLKESVAEFIVSNSFFHQLVGNQLPIMVVHGSNDSLVPYTQPIKLCNAIDGQSRPLEITNEHTMFACGTNSEVHLVNGAEHAMDFGLCFGTLCPAGPIGSGIRNATLAAVDNAYQWVGQTQTRSSRIRSYQLASLADNRSPSSNGIRQGGAGMSSSLLLVILFGFWFLLNKRRCESKKYSVLTNECSKK